MNAVTAIGVGRPVTGCAANAISWSQIVTAATAMMFFGPVKKGR
jgi:hypothetical protein